MSSYAQFIGIGVFNLQTPEAHTPLLYYNYCACVRTYSLMLAQCALNSKFVFKRACATVISCFENGYMLPCHTNAFDVVSSKRDQAKMTGAHIQPY